MKTVFLFIACSLIYIQSPQAQLIKKLKDKVNRAVEEAIDKPADKPAKPADKPSGKTEQNDPSGPDDKSKNKPVATTQSVNTGSYKVYSKFDFIPGNTILYYDNFEKDNIGETPEGWMTTNMSEVVEIEGLEGKWITLEPKGGAVNIVRSKKQSWGDNFTIEFDIFMEPGMEGQSEQLYIYLGNSGGKMVSDESLLNEIYRGDAIELYFGINKKDGTMYELTSYRNVATGKPGSKTKFSSDRDIKVNFLKPLHMSFCVQGKRLRFWMNEKKYLDINSAINPEVIPNLLGFKGHYYTNSKFFVSNIRIAKDVPDTRAEFDGGKIVSNLLFYSGTAKMKPESLGALFDISKVIKDASGQVKIVGHTDSDGDDALNLKLSQQRAEAVRDLLVKEYNIDASKLNTEGRGESQPIADNKTAEGKAQNRRVEFIFKAEADNYKPTAGTAAPSSAKAATTTTSKNSETAHLNNAPGSISLQSSILNTTLPYAQFMKGPKETYVLAASKEEGNSKENFMKITIKPVGGRLEPGTYLFEVQNAKNPYYGKKELPTITQTEAVLLYGKAQKPYISSFAPFISNQHESKYYNSGLGFDPPAPSDGCKLVIESLKDGKASGYFVMGIKTEGNNPVKIGDAMTRTITGKYEGQVKGIFKDLPVY